MYEWDTGEGRDAELLRENAKLQSENAELQSKNAEMQSKNAELQSKNDELRREIEYFGKRVPTNDSSLRRVGSDNLNTGNRSPQPNCPRTPVTVPRRRNERCENAEGMRLATFDVI